jgi:hypothetical protein
MFRFLLRCLLIFTLVVLAGTVRGWSQQKQDLEIYFRNDVGLNTEEIQAIRNGTPFAKLLRSRIPAEVFVFGAVYINAPPDAYLRLATDFDQLRKLPGYLALRTLSTPPEPRELDGFAFERDDILALQKCKPGDCEVQMPESYIQYLKNAIDWSASDPGVRVNQLLRSSALERLKAYQSGGNKMLGTYNDKHQPMDVAREFEYILSYTRALPEYLPAFHKYLLEYPRSKPANITDRFYWANVKFGLKPTLRMIHVVTMDASPDGRAGCAVAEKQLYASHYFQTALDLAFCVPDRSGSKQGFYLIKIMGSEQAGLTGFKGSVVRKVATDRSVSTLKKSLAGIKEALEAGFGTSRR